MRSVLIPVLASMALWSGCGGESQPREAAQTNAPAIPVQTAAVSNEQWPEVYEATATVRARTAAVLSSHVMAYVREVSVESGDHVREGQILVALDARELDSHVLRAQAAEAEAMSAIPEAEGGVAGAQANLDLAQSTFKRMQELASKKSISDQEFDEASARLKSAQAACEMARAKRRQLDSKTAQVRQELRAAGMMRDYARIAAPFSGVVTARSVEPGNLAVPGAPLLTLERDGNHRLEASVEESRLPFLKRGQSVDVVLEALDRRFTARVSEIEPSVDAASRTYMVKIDLPAVPHLRSGMFGRARFALGTRQVMAIPPRAILERGQLESVLVVEDGLAHTRLVTTGERGPASVEVLSGLSAGEKIVSPLPASLHDGARVEVRP